LSFLPKNCQNCLSPAAPRQLWQTQTCLDQHEWSYAFLYLRRNSQSVDPPEVFHRSRTLNTSSPHVHRRFTAHCFTVLLYKRVLGPLAWLSMLLVHTVLERGTIECLGQLSTHIPIARQEHASLKFPSNDCQWNCLT
jgi:hypothetical protein